jgi:hypothetical protein
VAITSSEKESRTEDISQRAKEKKGKERFFSTQRKTEITEESRASAT